MNYTKFIILGEERTGSTFLQMLLASNPSVLSLGEVFNPNEKIRRKGSNLSKFKEIARKEDPIEYLETKIFQKYPENVKAVGFRLFYTHARNDEWKAVWDYIRDSDIRIIHLKRKNLLDRYLSYQLAKISDVWAHLEKGIEEAKESIILNAPDCAKSFYKSEFWQKNADEFFQNNPKTILFYEDLCKYTKGESRRILDFLSLKPQELTTITEKQQTNKKSEVIKNFDDLKLQFIHGVSQGWARQEWIDFFDET